MSELLNIVHEAGDWKNALPNVEDISQHVLNEIDAELSLVLANDAFIQDLNFRFRQQNKPTNVLSFPSDESDYLGDIIVALETLQREAKEQSKSLQAHFTHMLIHGYLHLQGHDHEDDTQAEEMEKLEIEWLAKLSIANPYK